MHPPMSLFARTVKVAHDHPESRRVLIPILAREFPNQKALKDYLDDHPHADPSYHSVKDEGGGKGKGDEDEAEEKPKSDGEKKPSVTLKVDEAELKKRAPKVESEDLSAYPADAEADDLSPEHREEIKDYKLDIVGGDARQAVEIARKIKEGIKKGTDVCKVSPPVCAGNKGLTRDKMPQIEGEKSIKQMLESDNELDRKKGQAMVHAGADPDDDHPILHSLIRHLADHGVRTSESKVPVGALKATQSEIKAEKVYGMADAFLKGKFDKIDQSVVVSRDGYLLDGHHRWAALLTIDPTREMNVQVIDMDMDDLLKEAQAVPGVYKANFEGDPLPEAEQKAYKAKSKSKFSPPKEKRRDPVKPGPKKRKNGSLREGAIRLAYSNPALRPHLLAAIREAAKDIPVKDPKDIPRGRSWGHTDIGTRFAPPNVNTPQEAWLWFERAFPKGTPAWVLDLYQHPDGRYYAYHEIDTSD